MAGRLGGRSPGQHGRLADDQAAFRRVAEMVARDSPIDQVFAEISVETSRVLGDMAAAMLRFDPSREFAYGRGKGV